MARGRADRRIASRLLAALATAAAALGLAAQTCAIAQGSAAKPASATAASQWVAAAPGRIEPRSGEVKIGSSIPGRVAEVVVRVNETVEEGEMLLRIDDEEARARMTAAEAEAGARRRERDGQAATAGREEVRRAEDALFNSERAATNARLELDGALAARRAGTGTAETVAEVRKRLAEAKDKLQKDRNAYALAVAKANLPAPNRFESSLTAARADVSAADALFEKTRIRAPIAGTVLQLNAKAGEIVSPSPEQPLVVLGDMTVVRVKAEVDESDVGRVKLDQKAFVRSNAYPGRDFEGKVTALAPSLAAPRLSRGPRRPTDVEVLEVTIDLEGSVPLLPGMRVDAYFK